MVTVYPDKLQVHVARHITQIPTCPVHLFTNWLIGNIHHSRDSLIQVLKADVLMPPVSERRWETRSIWTVHPSMYCLSVCRSVRHTFLCPQRNIVLIQYKWNFLYIIKQINSYCEVPVSLSYVMLSFVHKYIQYISITDLVKWIIKDYINSESSNSFRLRRVTPEQTVWYCCHCSSELYRIHFHVFHFEVYQRYGDPMPDSYNLSTQLLLWQNFPTSSLINRNSMSMACVPFRSTDRRKSS